MKRRALLAGMAATAVATPSRAATATPIRLGYWGSPCEAATFVAPRSAAFVRRGLAVALARYPSQHALLAGLDRGEIDAGSVNLPELLTALDDGRAVRVAAGLHRGCLRVVARDAADLNSLRDLARHTIATDRLGGASMRLLSALLRRAGVDPARDVTWRVYALAELESALDARTVRAVAAADPLGFTLLSDRKAEPFLDSAGGGFSCGTDLAPSHHCFLALSGATVDRHATVAGRLTDAYLEATAQIGRGVGPAAVVEAADPLHLDVHAGLAMLGSYDWSASSAIVREEIDLTARDFQRARLLRPTTDPQGLAERAFVDLTHA